MSIEKSIKLIHFQITKRCNLRCSFCGQWGEKGFFSKAKGDEMSFSDWLKVISCLKEQEIRPTIMLWGGEPLLCEYFDELVYELKKSKFKLEIVTNGTFIDRKAEILSENFEKIYISVDGLETLHDSIRGKGVFEKVSGNIRLLPKEKITIMTVATPTLDIFEFADYFREYKILLQTMIFMTRDEIKQYKDWFKESFGYDATEIDSWEGKGFIPEYTRLPLNVELRRHCEGDAHHCMSPFSHIHIAWNGEVMYCTDFYDFSAGNVKNENLIDLWNNEKSEKFRSEIMSGNCITCNHCSWRLEKGYN